MAVLSGFANRARISSVAPAVVVVAAVVVVVTVELAAMAAVPGAPGADAAAPGAGPAAAADAGAAAGGARGDGSGPGHPGWPQWSWSPRWRKERRRTPLSESVPDIHSSARRDFADDGRSRARRHRCVPAVAGFGAAAGRLPDHSDPDVLSRRQPGSDGILGHCAARKAVRSGAGPDADDLDQLLRQFADHPAVRARSQHRHRRAGGAGSHQRRRYIPAARPARLLRFTARQIRPMRPF